MRVSEIQEMIDYLYRLGAIEIEVGEVKAKFRPTATETAPAGPAPEPRKAEPRTYEEQMAKLVKRLPKGAGA